MSLTRRPVLFLDRDGTLIDDVGYPSDPNRVTLLPDAGSALLALSAHYHLVVVSNQSGVARGLITPAQAAAVDSRFRQLFFEQGVSFAHVGYCFHAPSANCACRKPAPGLLHGARTALGCGPSDARMPDLMVGDKASDVHAGRTAGCYTFGFANDLDADQSVANWRQLVTAIMKAWTHD